MSKHRNKNRNPDLHRRVCPAYDSASDEDRESGAHVAAMLVLHSLLG